MPEQFTLLELYKVLTRIKNRIPVSCYVSFSIDEDGMFSILLRFKDRYLKKIFTHEELRSIKEHDFFIEHFIESFILDIKQFYKK